MKKIIVTINVLVLMLILNSCVLNFDVNPDDVDLAVSMMRDASCPDLSSYTITATGSYQKSFAASFTSDEMEQQWVGVPDEEFKVEIVLTEKTDSKITKYKYFSDLDKSWGNTLAFKAVCDESYDKPVLLLDVSKFVLVVNNTNECNWFSKVEFFEETGYDETTNQAFLQRLAEGSFDKLRMVYQWHEIVGASSVVHINLTDANNKVHKFRFPVKESYGQRLDFDISCDSSTLDVGMLMRTVDGKTYEPVPVGEDTDGDEDLENIDGDSEVDGDEDGDVDNAVDGDMEEDTETDGDLDLEVDGDSGEMENTESETEGEQELETDVEQACGIVAPSGFIELEAEDIAFTSDPPGFGNVWSCLSTDGDAEIEDCTNPFSGTGAVILDATDFNQDLILPVTITESWVYIIGVRYASGNTGFGIVELYVDESTEPLYLLGATESRINLDKQSTVIGPYSANPVDYVKLCLTAGEHQLKFRVVDSNTGGYRIGVDKIRIIPD